MITSEVPPIVEINDLYTFMTVHLIVVIITITDFTVCIRYNYRGGYFVSYLAVMMLILWILAYCGVNSHIINNRVCDIIRNIIIGGSITSALQILTQVMCLIVSYVRVKRY